MWNKNMTITYLKNVENDVDDPFHFSLLSRSWFHCMTKTKIRIGQHCTTIHVMVMCSVFIIKSNSLLQTDVCSILSVTSMHRKDIPMSVIYTEITYPTWVVAIKITTDVRNITYPTAKQNNWGIWAHCCEYRPLHHAPPILHPTQWWHLWMDIQDRDSKLKPLVAGCRTISC